MSWLSSLFGGGAKHANTNTQSGVDAHTAAQLGDIQNAFGQAGQAGPGPLLNGAAAYGTGAQQAGNLGFGALSGNPNAVAQMMSPYTQNVIDANNANALKAQQQGTNMLNGQATQANAFGGSRQGVAQGVMMANNQQNLNTLNANALNAGYQGAMQNANALAGYGMQGAQMNSNLGFGGVGNPALWNANMLKQGYMGPTGTYSNQQQTQQQNAGLGGIIQGLGSLGSLFL